MFASLMALHFFYPLSAPARPRTGEIQRECIQVYRLTHFPFGTVRIRPGYSAGQLFREIRDPFGVVAITLDEHIPAQVSIPAKA